MARYDDAHRAMQRRFDRLAVRAPSVQTSDVFEGEVDTAMRDIMRELRGARAKPLTAQAQRSMLSRVRTTLMRSAGTITADISDLQAEAHADSVRGLASFVQTMEGSRVEIASPRSLRTIQIARRKELEATLRQTVARNLSESMARMNAKLTALRTEGATIGQATLALEDALEDEVWRIQRIARTEASAAYNAGQLDGITALRAHYPDMMIRWNEHVSDSTWEPTDARTAHDSVALHGQVIEPGGYFKMPRDTNVSPKLWGEIWQHPPNRPNDRAVLMPWRRAWGVPAWTFSGGRRRWLVRQR